MTPIQLQVAAGWPPLAVVAYAIVGFWFTVGWFWLVPAFADAGAARWEQSHPVHLWQRRNHVHGRPSRVLGRPITPTVNRRHFGGTS